MDIPLVGSVLSFLAGVESWRQQMEKGFLIVMFVSGGILLLLFLLGEALHFIEHAIHGLFGAIEAVFDLGGDHLDIGGDHSFDHNDEGTVNPFNARTVFGFLTFFGASGYLSMQWFIIWLAPLFALIMGYGGGWLIWKFTKLVYTQSGSSHIREGECVGQRGEVLLTISPHDIGEVLVSVGSNRISRPARSPKGTAIPQGTEVIILEEKGGVLLVESVEVLLGSR